MKIEHDILDLLEFNKGIVALDKLPNNLTPLQNHLVKEITEKDFNIDCIYFSGEYPSVYFKKVINFDEESLNKINETHKKIWNQGKVAFLYVESPVEIRIYNCYHLPVNPKRQEQNLSDTELLTAKKDVAHELYKLKKIFGLVAIETGQFWKNISNQLINKNRVNKALIGNLKITRKKLKNIIGKNHENIVHDLLIRSLFILYLEDRGATDKILYDSYESFFNILDDRKATYRLFQKLESSFNGNLCPVSDEEKKIITNDHLKLIKACFWDKIEENGQLKFPFDWKPFDFKYIPIELISEIYEEFLMEIEGEKKKSKDGIYYTPHVLVEFILNKVLPWADENNKNYHVKILDPTCGSGVFLVEAFKRLVDRWEYSNPGKRIEFKDLIKMLEDNIYGIEIKKEAVKVTAFSLYLAILDKLEPKTLWQHKSFPYLIFKPDGSEIEKKGRNLYCMSSLEEGAFTKIDFDLVVGNPPFKRGNLPVDIKNYLSQKGFAQESSFAFLNRALTLCKNGKIALIAPSKAVLFNTLQTYQKFRKFLFNDIYIEEVINLSILRKVQKLHGGNLFAHAVGPSCILFYQKQFPVKPSQFITYYSPKTTIKNNIIDGIVFDQTDVKYLPRDECQKSDTKIWKIAMWGTERDFSFISRFENLNTINETFFKKTNDWHKGVGFETSNPCDKSDNNIKKLRHLSTIALERFYTNKDRTEKINFNMFRRLGTKQAYLAPHVLIKEGQGRQKFCASFIDYDCSFRKGVYGIKGKNEDIDKLKILTALLNSSFAIYYFFLTASSWGIERDVVKPNEFLNLPDLITNLNDSFKNQILEKINNIIKIKKNEFFNTDNKINSIEKKIDNILFEAFEFNEKEKFLIQDLLNYSLDLFVKKDKSKAYHKCFLRESREYAKSLCETINRFLEHGSKLRASATIFDIPLGNPLNLVIIKLGYNNLTNINEESSAKINSILQEINNYTYKPEIGTIYFRKIVKYHTDDTIYLIKPSEKRFWSRSMAMSDADAIIQETVSKK